MTTTLEDDLRKEIADSITRHLRICGFICDIYSRYRRSSIWHAIENLLPSLRQVAAKEQELGRKLMELADKLGIEPGDEPCVTRESQGTDQELT